MQTTPRAEALEVVPYDPYAAAPPLRWFRKVPNASLLLFGPFIAVVLIAGAASGGMLGTSDDFQPIKDIQRVLGDNDLSATDPFNFPLIRDTPVWFFAALMVAEVIIMNRQWRLLVNALQKLNRNRVLLPHQDDSDDLLDDAPTLRWLARFPAERRLAKYVTRVNLVNAARARIYTVLFVAAALVGSGLLVLGEQHGLFRVLAPDGLTPSEHDAWELNAYHHWWASTNHPGGAIAYFLLAALAIYLIIAQTHVGVRSARIAAALPRLVRVDANWVNPDGDYGWGPVREVFLTVWISMALYGVMVSGLAVVLGLGAAGWIPASIWLVLLTIYFVIPWAATRKIEASARERHIAMAQAEVVGASTKEQDELEARVQRYRKARIRPMRLGQFQRIPVALSVLLPVVLNIAQPYLTSLIIR